MLRVTFDQWRVARADAPKTSSCISRGCVHVSVTRRDVEKDTAELTLDVGGKGRTDEAAADCGSHNGDEATLSSPRPS